MTNTRHAVRAMLPAPGQTRLNDAFLCSATPARLASMSVAAHDQVRLEGAGKDSYALYTIIETSVPEASDDIIRMSSGGMARIGITAGATCVLDSTITRSALCDRTAEALSEFVERLDETNAMHQGLVVCAPHGGMVEAFTARQAERVFAGLQQAGKDVTCWRCKGWRQGGGAYDRWHISSTRISPRSFPLLGQLQNRGFRYAVAFHGYNGGGTAIQIGGSAPDSLKHEVADALRALQGLEHRVEITKPGSDYAGQSPANFVNWLTAGGAGGVQIEQPLDVREKHHQQIAVAVATVFAARL